MDADETAGVPDDDKIRILHDSTPDDAKSPPPTTPASPASPAASEGRETITPTGTVDPVYEAKAQVLNNAMLEIGFGRYHKALFLVAGFGWMADNVRASISHFDRLKGTHVDVCCGAVRCSCGRK